MSIQKRLIVASLFVSFYSAQALSSDAQLKIVVQEVESSLQAVSKHVAPPEPNCDTIKSRALPGLTPDFYKNGAKCDSFISSTGKLGAWGKAIDGYIVRQGSGSVFLSDSLSGMEVNPGFCPNWKKFSPEQKRHFWAWTFASIAFKESTCLPHAKNRKATNGVAIGLVQMDEKKKDRYWRGKNCAVASVANAEANLKCGMDIMGELLRGKDGMYKSNGQLFGKKNGSYWEQLRHPDGGTIGKLIMQYPLCR